MVTMTWSPQRRLAFLTADRRAATAVRASSDHPAFGILISGERNGVSWYISQSYGNLPVPLENSVRPSVACILVFDSQSSHEAK